MLLTPADLATRWSLSVQTLRLWRSDQMGPAFVKLGSRVRYRLEDVEAFEQFYLHRCKQPSAEQLADKQARASRKTAS